MTLLIACILFHEFGYAWWWYAGAAALYVALALLDDARP